MPDNVLLGKDGTVLTVGGTDMLGYFKTCRAEYANREVEHSGPQDDWEYSSVTRTGVTITVESYMPSSGGSTAIDLVAARTPVTVTTDLIDGRSLSGTFTPISASGEAGDDAGSESLTLKSYGEVVIT